MLKLNVKAKTFGKTDILHDIHLNMACGERVAILGASGIGKTSLLRIIAGLDRDFLGVRQAPKNINLMFQSPNLLPWRNAFDNLSVFHPKVSRRAIEAMLEAVGLAGKSSLFPSQLSLGQQRRLAMARAFLGDAPLVLFDEPFVSLDDQLRHEMIALTNQLLQERALILVTHNPSEAKMLTERQLSLEGNPASLHPL